MTASRVSGVDPRRRAVGSKLDALRLDAPVVYAGAVALAAGAYYLAGRIGLELAYLDGAVAALWPPAGLGPRGPVPLRAPAVARDRDRRPAASATSRRRSGRCSRRRSGTPWRSSSPRCCCAGSRAAAACWSVSPTCWRSSACALVAALISAAFGPLALRLGGVIDPDELGRVVPHLDARRRRRRARRRAGDPHLGEQRPHGLRPARADRGRGGARAARGAGRRCRRSATCPTSCSPCCCGRRSASGRAAPPPAILVVCSITVWNTAQNDGPFVRDSITDSLLATQLFIAISALTSLVLAAVTAERHARRGAAAARLPARARGRAGGAAQGGDARRRRRRRRAACSSR